ncbi:uncharacterized protein [Apostichopus japonicus]|uniref:uncharacterized protein isoform X2 n=1 Tax=Stichopus japonicus TaxID=307972 RepID=UPI003AB4A0B9
MRPMSPAPAKIVVSCSSDMTMDQGRQCVRRRGKLPCHPNEEDLQMDKDGFVERVLPVKVTFTADSSSTPDIPKKPQTGKRKLQRKYASRKPWKPEEKKCLLAFFKDAINSGTTPNRAMCELAKEQCETLQDRSWSQIKDFVVAERKRVLKKVQNRERLFTSSERFDKENCMLFDLSYLNGFTS